MWCSTSLAYISPFWHLTLYRMFLNLCPNSLWYKYVTRNAGLINGKHFHGTLHPIKRSALPHKLNREVVSTVDGHTNIAPQLQSNFFTETRLQCSAGELIHMHKTINLAFKLHVCINSTLSAIFYQYYWILLGILET